MTTQQKEISINDKRKTARLFIIGFALALWLAHYQIYIGNLTVNAISLTLSVIALSFITYQSSKKEIITFDIKMFLLTAWFPVWLYAALLFQPG